MSFPMRFVAMSCNVWADKRWPERAPALRAFFTRQQPDVLCLQELRPALIEILDELLPHHERVQDDFVGWSHEGNVYWNAELFDLAEFGAEEIGSLQPDRRLFWVRLRARSGGELLVATAHFSAPNNALERAEGVNPRLAQADATARALARLADAEQAVLFMGDLNDACHPLRILEDAGLRSAFHALGQELSPTFPVRPTSAYATPQVLDWMLHRGPVRPLTAAVVDFFEDGMSPSDHRPVVATFAFDQAA